MTNEEIIDGLKVVDKECGKHLNEGFAWMSQIINESIKALEQEPTISEDGTLTVQVKDGKEVNRVLVCGDNHWGGLYYAEDEPCEDAKHKLIKDCQPPTDDWEHYADRLHDIAYKSGYEQAQKDMAEQEPCEDAISRKAAIDGLASIAKAKAKSDAQKSMMGRSMYFIEHLPPVSPARPTGHNCNTDYAECDQFVCSECGIELQDWHRVERDEDNGEVSYHEYEFKFCPNCGAKLVTKDTRKDGD